MNWRFPNGLRTSLAETRVSALGHLRVYNTRAVLTRVLLSFKLPKERVLSCFFLKMVILQVVLGCFFMPFLHAEAEHAKALKRGKNKWQTTTKGTLKRRYRVPTKSEGRRLLNLISSLLSDDDTFRDATSHKVSFDMYGVVACCNEGIIFAATSYVRTP